MSYLKALVMGGVDGVITSFAVAAGASLMNNATTAVTVVGFSSVVADGLSMGISEYVSSISEEAITQRRGSPMLMGLLCFVSFATFGSFPLVMFLVAKQKLLSCAAFSLVELMILGSCQTFITGQSLLKGLIRTTVLGTCAGLTAYGIAHLARDVDNVV